MTRRNRTSGGAVRFRGDAYPSTPDAPLLTCLIEGFVGGMADLMNIVKRYQGVIYTATFLGIVVAALLTQ